ncbi:MAG: adenylate/guanylate cyclase domain-containing protein, partial [Verrucomicrobiota bacterium]
IEVSCGIAFGKVLLLPGFDYFGTAVNRACKLGEDLASAGEIFVTAKAMDRVPGTPYQTEPFTTTLSGIYLPAHKIVYS